MLADAVLVLLGAWVDRVLLELRQAAARWVLARRDAFLREIGLAAA